MADKLARFANQVLVLDKGAVTASLEPSRNWLKNKIEDFQSANMDVTEKPSFQASISRRVGGKPSKSENNNAKLKRQVGDNTVWVYYIKSIGAFHCLALLLFTLIAVLAANFPRMCYALNYLVKLTRTGLWLKDSDRSRSSLGLFIGIYAMVTVLESTGMAAMLW